MNSFNVAVQRRRRLRDGPESGKGRGLTAQSPREGTLRPATPTQVIQRLQQTAGNRAVAAALFDHGRVVDVQRLGQPTLSKEQRQERDDRSRLSALLDDPFAHPKVWKSLSEYAKSEYSAENIEFHELYVRAKKGSGRAPKALFDLAYGDGKDPIVNIPAAVHRRMAALKQLKDSDLEGGLPINLFDDAEQAVQANISDTISRWSITDEGSKALRTQMNGLALITRKINKFFGLT